MSAISRDDVAHLATLAHIAMNEDELKKMSTELDAIVDAVASVSEAATEDIPATSHPIRLTNVMRDDVVGNTLTQAQALSNAPDAEDGRFRVPAILDQD